MSPQRSNRQALIEGALRCIEESPSARITARQIAAASQANLASIRYHFGSTDALLGKAMEEGFHRWLQELALEMGEVAGMSPTDRFRRASDIVAESVVRHAALVRAFLAAVARASHDDTLRESLAKSYSDSRQAVAWLLGLGADEDASSAASIVLATFDGLLIQAVLNPEGGLDAAALRRGMDRLAAVSSDL